MISLQPNKLLNNLNATYNAKSFITAVLASTLLAVYSCKGHKAENEQNTAAATQPSSSSSVDETKPATTASATPKSYTVAITPDTVSMGKNGEAFIKVKNLKAIDLSNPDGATTGIEITYELEVTNKASIGGSRVYVNPDNFRLELDNGTKLTHDTYNSVTVEPDATASSSGNVFKLPAGTKPVSLALFYDETRAVLKLAIK